MTDPRVHVRPARAADADAVGAMARDLSGQTVRLRFMGGIARDVAVGELRREILSGTDGIALVAEDERGAIVGEAYAALVDARTAEAAFVVADAWQHHGVGTALRTVLFDELRKRGVRRVQLETFPDNLALRHLVKDARLPTSERFSEGTIAIEVDLRASQPAA
ncbi:MAG: GNAT family N-acetyltransferase [Candidatus Eremiobacteraeota bacterium]|nr:GNAT family N-acetyltransferase [Candidatus Eremiobacteraeota bacterium]